jgi:hypothetical protein
VIELTAPQFLALLGFSASQLAVLTGIFFRLGKVLDTQSNHSERILNLERKPA